jgi:hypothetical protein
MRKAQTSAEYLIILAIVLIVTVIVLMIVIETPKTQSTYEDESSQEYWRNADIGLVAWAANGSHITMKVQNNMPNTVEIEEIYVNNIISYNNDFTLEPGKSKIITGNFIWDENMKGDVFEAEVYFNYEDIDTAHTYSFYGLAEIRGTLTTI